MHCLVVQRLIVATSVVGESFQKLVSFHIRSNNRINLEVIRTIIFEGFVPCSFNLLYIP